MRVELPRALPKRTVEVEGRQAGWGGGSGGPREGGRLRPLSSSESEVWTVVAEVVAVEAEALTEEGERRSAAGDARTDTKP